MFTISLEFSIAKYCIIIVVIFSLLTRKAYTIVIKCPSSRYQSQGREE